MIDKIEFKLIPVDKIPFGRRQRKSIKRLLRNLEKIDEVEEAYLARIFSKRD